MDNNGKDTKHTGHIDRRVHLVRNSEKGKYTRLTGVREVFNCHTFQLGMLVRMA